MSDDLPSNNPTTTTIDSLTAQRGSVAVGVAKDGSTIIVYNIAVNEGTVQGILKGSDFGKRDGERVTRDFLEYVAEYFRYLPLKGMGSTGDLRLNFPLTELFIPLNARLTLPRGDVLSDELRVGGKRMLDEELESLGGVIDKPMPVLDLIGNHPVLVILGDPGSGKSTVLKFLALLAATGQGDQLGFIGYLPLFLPLAAYSEELDRDPSLTVYRFAVEFFAKNMDMDGIDFLLKEKLHQGQVLIMLDGLDEVKETSLRAIVVDRVQSFICRHIERGNRVLMTSRIIGYREVRPPEVKGLRECTLLDFNKKEVETFIRRWSGIVERQACEGRAISEYRAETEAEELLAALNENSSIAKLASNPLLLTMLVVQKRQGVSLPRHRVLLYKQYVDSLLYHWLLARNEQVRSRDLPNERAIKKILEPLAYEMQQSEPGKGLLSEEDLLTRLSRYFPRKTDPKQAALDFVRDVREYSGLLVDRGGRKFGFLHLTFMEYLAGAFLAKKIQKGGLGEVVDIMATHGTAGEWRETLLLAIGYLGLVMELDESAEEVLHKLLSYSGPGKGSLPELVGAVLADIGPDGVTIDGWDELRLRLVDRGLRNPAVTQKYRFQIGNHLAEIGDPRDEVMEANHMQFCFVQAGPFYMGAAGKDKFARSNEKKGAGGYNLAYDYWMARFPVTVAQYGQFVEQAGHIPFDNDCMLGAVNAPVVSVTWYEAKKFCRWLTERWRFHGWLPAGYIVTLPNEPEWEKAARGGYSIPGDREQQRLSIQNVRNFTCGSSFPIKDNAIPQGIFPWGDKPDRSRNNYRKSIDKISAVGCYFEGCSAQGCEEMCDKIWEWTRSEFQPYPYPKTAKKIREREIGDDHLKTVRGGMSYSCDKVLARCTFRLGYSPGDRDLFQGFRVVLSPLSLKSETSER